MKKILTANRLVDGEAVWYVGGAWAETIDGAEIADDKEGEERLEAIGKAAFLRNEVLDVALVDVALEEDGRIVPTRLRERIRAAGPSTRGDVGKQARRGVSQAA
jgi:hypothetical protein